MRKKGIKDYKTICVKAICGETFTFRTDTIEDLVKAIIEKAENPNSNFSYFDAGAVIIKEELAKELIGVADEMLEKLNELIADIMTRREEQANN